MFQKIADFLVKNREKMPAWCTAFFGYLANNPQSFLGRITVKLLGGNKTAPNTTVPEKQLRVYIGSANYAAQGYKWARALESACADLGARNVEHVLPGGFNFPADTKAEFATVNAGSNWSKAEFHAASTFTHLLAEAQKPLFGTLFNRNIATEVAQLKNCGVNVALMCHGTEIRNPKKHQTLTAWSPYPVDPRTASLQKDADNNLALLQELQLPVFVSTPDLLADVPEAIWCPVVVDTEMFKPQRPILDHSGSVKIVHSASIPVQKGSDLIAPAIEELVAKGLVDYTLITGTSWAKMPEIYAGADIVLDQFRLGSYGVAACEAMAAGRVVVGHVLPGVRKQVKQDFGIELPIVEANPDNIAEVLQSLIADPERMRALSRAGVEFVSKVHSGPASAEVLLRNWILKP